MSEKLAQWEYATNDLSANGVPLPLGKLDELLQIRGEEGWELVAVVQFANKMTMFWKRPQPAKGGRLFSTT